MKIIIQLVFLLVFFSEVTQAQSCTIFSTVTPSSYSICNGSIQISIPGMCAPISYSWSNGSLSGSQFSLCAGIYTVQATSTNTACCPFAIGVFTVQNTCSLTVNFQYLTSGNTVSFTSTSIGTFTGSTYLWNFGDGNTASAGTQTQHTYANSGVYNAYLVASNNSLTCIDSSAVQSITVSPCVLTPGFTAQKITSDSLYFTNTSTGTWAGTSYFWQFGDGNTSTLNSTGHRYLNPANYNVTLTVNNNYTPTCSSFTSMTIMSGCTLIPSFSHTVTSGGVVKFSNTSIGSNTNSSFFWRFGDGYTDIAPAPTHTYTNGGTHYVALKITINNMPLCTDSITQALNVTGIACQANSGFSVISTSNPSLKFVIPYYPYNITGAKWDWGDGNFSHQLYASHVYSASGTYSLCFSATVSCGLSSTTCVSQAAKNADNDRGAGTLTINVISPAEKVGFIEETYTSATMIYPVPSSGEIFIHNNSSILRRYTISDLNGHVIRNFETQQEGLLRLDLEVDNGIYLLNEITANGNKLYRLIILKE